MNGKRTGCDPGARPHRSRATTGGRRRCAALSGILITGLTVLGAACGDGDDPAAGGGAFERPPTGTIEAAEAITVVSEIPGIVVRLPFREGGHVARGALLAQIDDAELRAALARAEAIREQREAAFKRVELVVNQGAGTPQDLDDAAADLKIARADVDLAAARLAKARITAPFAGRVGPRKVSPGAFLQPGTPITHLARLDEIKVVFTAPERYVPKLERGATVAVSTMAFPGHELSGIIDVIDPVLDPDTRSTQVIVRAANPDGRFRPGMSADVRAVLSRRDEALTIPSEAVFAEGDQSLVYRVEPDSSVARTPVTLGTRLAGVVEVLSGLEAGQRVVRAGHQKLYPGARVMPVDSRADGGGASGPGPTSGGPEEAGSPDPTSETAEGEPVAGDDGEGTEDDGAGGPGS
jgi:membrane fusion protein (multidrug efflux system)